MQDKSYILQLIKDSVHTTVPGATIILYGSYARGDYREDSDIDLLILVDKDKITHQEEIRITHPLYAIEFETGTVISPLVYTKDTWAKRKVTPFYENVLKDGRAL